MIKIVHLSQYIVNISQDLSHLIYLLIVHVGHVRQSNHINVSLIHVPRSASVHIMAVDTHTTVPNCREQIIMIYEKL